MMNFTYITAAIIGIGLICMLIPYKWYNKSYWDFRISGFWITMLTIGLQISTWSIYGLIKLIKFLFLTYVLTWGNAI